MARGPEPGRKGHRRAWVAGIALTAALAGPAAAEGPAPFIHYAVSGDGAGTVVDASGADARTPFAIASAGKIATSVAVLRLAARGALDLDAPVVRFVPAEIRRGYGGMEGVTLRHLLTMTSGLPDYLDDAFVEAAIEGSGGVQTPLGALRHGSGQAPLFEPGEDFDYSNTNYVLLGLVLEEVSRAPYSEVVAREVLRPAGLEDSFVFGSRALPAAFAAGHPEAGTVRGYYSGPGLGDGGVISTARDLARLYRAIFLEGKLLPPAMLDVLLEDPLGVGYGAGVEIEWPVVGHAGGDLGYASDIRMDLETGDVAVVLAAEEDAETGWAWDWLEPD